MSEGAPLPNESLTLTFDQFWTWLKEHPNCVLRCGTPEVVVCDDDDMHWVFSNPEAGSAVVQVLRGKRLIAEMMLATEPITYVQQQQGENGEEWFFELVCEAQTDRIMAAFFVLSHGYDTEDPPPPDVWIN